MSYGDVERWLECPFQWPFVRKAVGARAVPGVDLILVCVWCEFTGYGQCTLVDRGHGGRRFSLIGRPVLWNGVTSDWCGW